MRAIDSHIHFSTEKGYLMKDPKVIEAMEKYYRYKVVFRTDEEMAQDFIDQDIKAVLMPIDCETATGGLSTATIMRLPWWSAFPRPLSAPLRVSTPGKGRRPFRNSTGR